MDNTKKNIPIKKKNVFKSHTCICVCKMFLFNGFV